LFAERGIEAVSIRDITRAAGANLAAINYHFGTKQELVGEIFSRRLTPLSQGTTGFCWMKWSGRRRQARPAGGHSGGAVSPGGGTVLCLRHGNKAFMQLFRTLFSANRAAAIEHPYPTDILKRRSGGSTRRFCGARYHRPSRAGIILANQFHRRRDASCPADLWQTKV